MFCKNCGAEIEDGKKFCTKCGQDLSKKVVENNQIGESSYVNQSSLNPKVASILKIIYRLSILVFGVIFMSQSLVSCNHKGYECFVDTFKPDSCLMISSSDLIYGINHGGIGVYIVSFITMLYIWLLLLSFIQKEVFWKKNIHTNLFISIILTITTVLYNKFGDSNFKPTHYTFICCGISIFTTIVYLIMSSMVSVDNKNYSLVKRFLILLLLMIIYIYLFGAIIPFTQGNIS